jgi:hypothetical protein
VGYQGGGNSGIAFETTDDPVQADPRLFDYNWPAKAQQFAQDMRYRAAFYRTPHILVAVCLVSVNGVFLIRGL